MKPFLILAQAKTLDGNELTLHAHDGHFFLRLNRQPLMGTNASESEKILSELACGRLCGQKKSRVLIGGLGFGFTLKRVLELVGPDATVNVVELMPEVVKWNREFLGEVNGMLLDDPRVRIIVEDVYNVLARSSPSAYDAIILDVDNGPVAMVKDSNWRLYQNQGFAVISRILSPGGRVTFWSSHRDDGFARRLTQAGFSVDTVRAKSHERAKRARHTIFVGARTNSGTPKGQPTKKRDGVRR